jgi:hypothetical protein
MSIHDSRLLAALCLVATVSSYGCDSDNGWKEERADRIGPSQIGFNGLGEPTTNSTDFFARGVTLQPAIVTPQLVPARTAHSCTVAAQSGWWPSRQRLRSVPEPGGCRLSIAKVFGGSSIRPTADLELFGLALSTPGHARSRSHSRSAAPASCGHADRCSVHRRFSWRRRSRAFSVMSVDLSVNKA